MNVNGLSRDNVASHLQKHRLGLKRGRARKRRTMDATGSLKAKLPRKLSTRVPVSENGPIAGSGEHATTADGAGV
jgi:hypothetical protein